MVWFKRITLFVVTNILVILTFSVIANIFGITGRFETASGGMNFESLLLFCALFGFGGAFFSLAISRISAKWMTGAKVIDPNTLDTDLRELVQTVHRMSRQAGLTTMPQVAVYDSPELNAFATGPTKNRALVAVSTGLLRSMDRKQVEGVLGHEVAHIANGDMVTMTLLQGVVNTFVMFAARVIAFAISNFLKGQDEKSEGLSGLAYFAVVFVLEMVFMILGSMVIAAFSRHREYRADEGGARLAGRQNMISALDGLRKMYEPLEDNGSALQTMKIASGSRWMAVFSTHPPLEVRIERLQKSIQNG